MTSINIPVKLLTPEEFFDIVRNSEGRVNAHFIYHKEMQDISLNDLFSVFCSPFGGTDYFRVSNAEKVYFAHWPVEYFMNKAEFCEKFSGLKTTFIIADN